MSVAKKFKLQRVGAGPGIVLFSCEHVLGDEVEVVDAKDHAELVRKVTEAVDCLRNGYPNTALKILKDEAIPS